MLSQFLEEMFHQFDRDVRTDHEEAVASSSCATRLNQAIEYVVNETSGRLRVVRSYSRRLRGPVSTAFKYIDELVEQVPGVFSCERSTFVEDPRVHSLFVNPLHLQETFSQSKEVRELFDENGDVNQCFALLCMHLDERQQFGMALTGDSVRKDVLQTTYSFSDHQVVTPGSTEVDARCALKCCIFKSLVDFIRTESTDARKQTTDLEIRRNALHARKMRLGNRISDSSRNKLEKQIDAIEAELDNLELRISSAEDYFKYVAEVLNHPERFLFGRTYDIYIDRMGVQQETGTEGSGYKLSLAEIQIAHQQPRVAALVSFPRKELLPKKDLLHEATMFLAH